MTASYAEIRDQWTLAELCDANDIIDLFEEQELAQLRRLERERAEQRRR